MIFAHRPQTQNQSPYFTSLNDDDQCLWIMWQTWWDYSIIYNSCYWVKQRVVKGILSKVKMCCKRHEEVMSNVHDCIYFPTHQWCFTMNSKFLQLKIHIYTHVQMLYSPCSRHIKTLVVNSVSDTKIRKSKKVAEIFWENQNSCYSLNLSKFNKHVFHN